MPIKMQQTVEEIYIIKLKGLPISEDDSPHGRINHPANFYYTKDLSAEALFGFGAIHLMLGSVLIIFSIVSLSTTFQKANDVEEIDGMPEIGLGIWCGAIFALTGLTGILTSFRRKRDISRSQVQVRVFFTMSLVSVTICCVYLSLVTAGIWCEKSSRHFVSINIAVAYAFEFLTAVLSIFTCARIIWPGSMACCARDWPARPKLKRKVIVTTDIFTNGGHRCPDDFIRHLGPNCVISLTNPPPSLTANGIVTNCSRSSIPSSSGKMSLINSMI